MRAGGSRVPLAWEQLARGRDLLVLLAQARVFRRRAYANGRRDAFHWWLFNAACRATRRAARTAR